MSALATAVDELAERDPDLGRAALAELATLHQTGYHPLRQHLAALFAADPGKTWSPVVLAAEARVPLGTLSYHVRLLVKARIIRLADTQQRRGAIEHFYRLATIGTLRKRAAAPRTRKGGVAPQDAPAPASEPALSDAA